MRKINFFTHAILRTLPRRFCTPFLFTFHYYLRMLWCASPLMPIKLFDYTIQLTFFLHKPTYSCYKLQIPKLRTIDTKLTNYWYKTYELLIQNFRTFDTKPTNYQSILLQTADFKISNYQSFLIQTPDSNITNYQSFLLMLTRSKIAGDVGRKIVFH